MRLVVAICSVHHFIISENSNKNNDTHNSAARELTKAEAKQKQQKSTNCRGQAKSKKQKAESKSKQICIWFPPFCEPVFNWNQALQSQ